MSTYIPGDPAGIYGSGRGAGLMVTPKASVPGYGADATPSIAPNITLPFPVFLGGLTMLLISISPWQTPTNRKWAIPTGLGVGVVSFLLLR